MAISATFKQRKLLEKANAQWPEHLVEVPNEGWPSGGNIGQSRVLRSREFLVQIFPPSVPGLVARITVNRTSLKKGRWVDDISWDELQRLKSECGFAEYDAVEVYPAHEDVVNVANMRHLWVLDGRLNFAWRVSKDGNS